MTIPEGPLCYFFGCWNNPGHFTFLPGGGSLRGSWEWADYYRTADGQRMHVDGSLAPRKWQSAYYGVGLCWVGQGKTERERERINYNTNEVPQGQFFRHFLSTGYTAIQWWDRSQGDGRGACNSTVFLRGEHTTEEMLAALAEHFPHVLANLKRAGVELVELVKP